MWGPRARSLASWAQNHARAHKNFLRCAQKPCFSVALPLGACFPGSGCALSPCAHVALLNSQLPVQLPLFPVPCVVFLNKPSAISAALARRWFDKFRPNRKHTSLTNSIRRFSVLRRGGIALCRAPLPCADAPASFKRSPFRYFRSPPVRLFFLTASGQARLWSSSAKRDPSPGAPGLSSAVRKPGVGLPGRFLPPQLLFLRHFLISAKKTFLLALLGRANPPHTISLRSIERGPRGSHNLCFFLPM